MFTPSLETVPYESISQFLRIISVDASRELYLTYSSTIFYFPQITPNLTLWVMQLAHFDFLILFHYTNEGLKDLNKLGSSVYSLPGSNRMSMR